jgi:hypothetical protein
VLVSVQMRAQFLDCAFTQEIGIALAGLGKFDNSLGDESVGEIVCKPKGYASRRLPLSEKSLFLDNSLSSALQSSL